MTKAILGFENGVGIVGKHFGAKKAITGELVFATPYTGYVEALTDPSYNGQILLFTYPLVGNYGINYNDCQSDRIQAEGFAIRELCDHPTNDKKLDEFLKTQNIPGIWDIDTRMVTIMIRDEGAMRASLLPSTTGSDADVKRAINLARSAPDISHLDLISEVTCKEPYRIPGKGKRIVLMDFGVKQNMLNNLKRRDIDLIVVPSDTPGQQVADYKADALLLSNGPGDPIQAKNGIDAVRELAGQLPIFGICLGHQIIALALGGGTFKLKFGHRGANQPVLDLRTQRVYITAQNHGYAVNLEEGGEMTITQVNANDNTVEGIRNEYLRIMSVQYHPEASPGPHDLEKSFFDEITGAVRDSL